MFATTRVVLFAVANTSTCGVSGSLRAASAPQDNTTNRILDELADPLNELMGAMDEIKLEVMAIKQKADASSKWMG